MKSLSSYRGEYTDYEVSIRANLIGAASRTNHEPEILAHQPSEEN